MKDQPHIKILEREGVEAQINEHFSDVLSLIEELVNYGTNLIPRCFDCSNKDVEDVVVIISLLKQGVTLLDSIHVLAKKGLTAPSYLSLRSLYEISIYLEWIFKENTKTKSLQYYVCDLRHQLYWEKCGKEGTQENKVHKEEMKGLPLVVVSTPEEIIRLDAEIARLEGVLSSPKFALINQMFDAKKMKLNDQHWYRPSGIDSFRGMARSLNREGEYIVFYKSYSNITHGSVFDLQVSHDESGVVFEHIRNIKKFDEIVRMAITLALRIYRQVLEYYRPAELPNFGAKFENEWRERFNFIPSVKYKQGQYVIRKVIK